MSVRAPGSGPSWPGARRRGKVGTGTRSAAIGFIAVALIACTMRAPITVAGPILPSIAESLNSLALAGLLVSLPLLAFSVAAPVFPLLVRHLTLARAVQVVLSILVVGLIVRQGVHDVPLLAGTALVGVGIASLNVSLPVIVQSFWPRTIALMTGVFTSITAVAASLAAGLALPLAAVQGWPWSLGVVGAAVAIAAAAAAILIPAAAPSGGPPTHRASSPRLGHILRHPTTLTLVALMALQAGTYYCLVSWLPATLLERGLSGANVAGAQAVFVLLSVLAGPLAGAWLQSGRALSALGIVATAPLVAALLGLAYLPDVFWLWVVLAGGSCGAIFAITLALFGLKGASGAVTAKLSAAGHVFGYAIAATMPPFAGAIFTASGSWRLVLVVLAAVAVAQCVIAFLALRATVIGDATARAAASHFDG